MSLPPPFSLSLWLCSFLLISGGGPASVLSGTAAAVAAAAAPKTAARISNERSTEIIDGDFEFASHYTGLEHFGLMRIKDSKGMHFVSIRPTTHGRGKRERSREWKREEERTQSGHLELWRKTGAATAEVVYGWTVAAFLVAVVFSGFVFNRISMLMILCRMRARFQANIWKLIFLLPQISIASLNHNNLCINDQ